MTPQEPIDDQTVVELLDRSIKLLTKRDRSISARVMEQLARELHFDGARKEPGLYVLLRNIFSQALEEYALAPEKGGMRRLIGLVYKAMDNHPELVRTCELSDDLGSYALQWLRLSRDMIVAE